MTTLTVFADNEPGRVLARHTEFADIRDQLAAIGVEFERWDASKPLKPDENTKVVGIKYERVAAAAPKGPIFRPKKQGSPGVAMREHPRLRLENEDEQKVPARKESSRKPAKSHQRFSARVTLVATQLVKI